VCNIELRLSGLCDVRQVVVTGAGGRTGQLIVKKLLDQKDQFTALATVRSKSSGNRLLADGLPESSLIEFDLATAAADGSTPASLTAALQGADALIIATSGVPQIKYLSLIPVFWAKLTGKEGVRPEFTWKQGQMPEQVIIVSIPCHVTSCKACLLLCLDLQQQSCTAVSD
jgi:NAD(P)-dependent dehydrogenase (short-subunit alcohol dehydrogenase family)